jgi:hypothetical protein
LQGKRRCIKNVICGNIGTKKVKGFYSERSKKMPARNSFMIISPHTKQECLDALDAVARQGRDSLNKWEWGCMSGDHTAYVLYEADSEEAALRMVPENVRPKARVIKVDKFTPEQIRSFHEQHA